MKKLAEYANWELQKELDKRNAFQLAKVLDQIKEIEKNYNAGLIDGLEAITQIYNVAKFKREEYLKS